MYELSAFLSGILGRDLSHLEVDSNEANPGDTGHEVGMQPECALNLVHDITQTHTLNTPRGSVIIDNPHTSMFLAEEPSEGIPCRLEENIQNSSQTVPQATMELGGRNSMLCDCQNIFSLLPSYRFYVDQINYRITNKD